MVKSMFDPYRDQIKEWCDQGLTITQMVEELGGYFVPNTLYTYIDKHKLRTVTVYDARNKCDSCEYCQVVKNAMGKYDKACRLCKKSWRMISASVVHSPRWCEKGAK